MNRASRPSLWFVCVLHGIGFIWRLMLVSGVLLGLDLYARARGKRLTAILLEWPHFVFVLGPTVETLAMPYSYERFQMISLRLHWLYAVLFELAIISISIVTWRYGSYLIRKDKTENSPGK